MEQGQHPRPGSRDNGLRCPGYLAIGDVDPQVADALLDRLRDAGIAAYVVPSPQPDRIEGAEPAPPTDRLYADTEHVERAADLLAQVSPTPTPTVTSAATVSSSIDFDDAWQSLLGSLQSTTTSTVRPWPASEEVEPGAFATPAAGTLDEDPILDEHFVPPPPPPLPRLRKETIIGLLAMLAGIVILGTNLDGGGITWLAVLAIVTGAGVLIWNVKDGPPRDSGGDDGAVV
jgi:hypothetical protein